MSKKYEDLYTATEGATCVGKWTLPDGQVVLELRGVQSTETSFHVFDDILTASVASANYFAVLELPRSPQATYSAFPNHEHVGVLPAMWQAVVDSVTDPDWVAPDEQTASLVAAHAALSAQMRSRGKASRRR